MTAKSVTLPGVTPSVSSSMRALSDRKNRRVVVGFMGNAKRVKFGEKGIAVCERVCHITKLTCPQQRARDGGHFLKTYARKG